MNNSPTTLELLISAVNEASDVLAEVSSSLDELSSQTETTSTGMSEALDSATASAEGMAGAMSDAAASTSASFVDLGASADEYAANLKAIQTAAAGAEGEILVMGDEAAATSDIMVASAAKTAAATDAATASTSGLSDALKGGGAGGIAAMINNPYVLAGAAIAGAFTLAIVGAANFQTGMTTLYDTAGETAPYEQLSNAILGVAAATGESAQSMVGPNGAMYVISSAGFSAMNGVQVLTAATEGAKEEGANVTSVASALTSVMDDYGASASQSTGYMNQLLTIVSLGKTTLSDLAPALAKVLQPAAAVGLSLANVGSAIDVITSKGVDAQQATQDVEALIKELSGATVTTPEINNLAQYGLNITTIEKNLGKEGLAGTVEEVWDAITKKITANGLVTQNALQSSLVLYQNLMEELQNAPSSVQGLANELMNGQISYAQFRTQSEALSSEGDANFLKQIEATYNKINSYNPNLLSGKPGTQTPFAALSGVFGQSDTLQAVQAILSDQGQVQTNQDKINKALTTSGKNVQGWSAYTNTLNGQWGILWQTISTGAIKFGTVSLPYVTDAIKIAIPFVGGFFTALTDTFQLSGDAIGTFAAIFTGNTKALKKDWDKWVSDLIKDFNLEGVAKNMEIGIGGSFDFLVLAAIDSTAAIGKAFVDVWNDIAGGATSLVKAIAKSFTVLPGEIGSALGGAGTSGVKDVLHALHVPGFASGVQDFSGGFAMVGENGPELAYLPSGSSVYPSGQAPSGMGQTTIQVSNPQVIINGPAMGTNAQIQQWAEVMWQNIMAKAKANGLAANMPNIGVRWQ